ncbi:hypothetical protein FXO38_17599 [Capsicum annuum]|nr:hypothetical protein FXO38_17599 [Capsicum annuum]KAF3654016.1 hypothetical protein FXO37_16695 [Capsicum annuum]
MDISVETESLMVSKKDMELNNARGDVRDVVDPNTVEALLDKNEHQSDSGSPKCQIAHPKLTNMLMQEQVASLVCPLPALKPLTAILDASVFEIFSPSMEPFGFQTKRYEPGALVEDTMQAFDGDLGFDKFDEEDEDKVLDECFAKVAKDGDLSPRQQRKGFKTKKTHEKKYSWDTKVSEEVILRQLPMRVAK